MKALRTIILCTFSLAVGAIAGFSVSKSIYKKKFQKYADEEIDSVKRVYAKHYGEAQANEPEEVHEAQMPANPNEEKPADEATGDEKPPLNPAYVDYSAPYRSQEPEVRETRPNPEPSSHNNDITFLTVEELEASKRECITLFYYQDGVLADDDYNIIKNPESLIGDEALSKFGAYDVNAVYVHNAKTNKDYEILLDNRPYVSINPRGGGYPEE